METSLLICREIDIAKYPNRLKSKTKLFNFAFKSFLRFLYGYLQKNLADELFYKWTLFSAYCLIWKTHEKAMPMSAFLSLCKKNEETRNRQKLMANLYCYSCVQIELLTKC